MKKPEEIVNNGKKNIRLSDSDRQELIDVQQQRSAAEESPASTPTEQSLSELSAFTPDEERPLHEVYTIFSLKIQSSKNLFSLQRIEEQMDEDEQQMDEEEQMDEDEQMDDQQHDSDNTDSDSDSGSETGVTITLVNEEVFFSFLSPTPY